MNNRFIDISNKCKRPTIVALREALKERDKLSESESNFITYMAGFSHYEFAESLFEEFGLTFICDRSFLFDKYNQKLHLKILINDLMDLSCLNTIEELDEDIIDSDVSFQNIILWKDTKGIYVENLYGEIGKLNLLQYQEYCENHIIGLNENIFPFNTKINDLDLVLHITTVARNVVVNLATVLNKVSYALFVNDYDDRANLSVSKLRATEDTYILLPKIKWHILENESCQEVTNFFKEINTEYTLIYYKGEEYNYFADFISDIQDYLLQSISLSNLI